MNDRVHSEFPTTNKESVMAISSAKMSNQLNIPALMAAFAGVAAFMATDSFWAMLAVLFALLSIRFAILEILENTAEITPKTMEE